MQFIVHMRDGASFRVEASYIEVVGTAQPSYTFLGPVPGYPTAILASFPLDLVAAVVPARPPAGSPRTAGGTTAGTDAPAAHSNGAGTGAPVSTP